MHASPVCRRLHALFLNVGESDYIGEPLSMLAHSLQAAALSSKQQHDGEVTVAALLHDVGHAIGMEAGFPLGMNNCGIPEHESVGEEFLRQHNFTARIQKLVRHHVTAKRYLCWKNPGYFANLSDASRTTLGFQGGPMTDQEAALFEKDPDFEVIILMRKWDEAAKVPGLTVPGFESYFHLLDKFSQQRPQEDPSYVQFQNEARLGEWMAEIGSWPLAAKKGNMSFIEGTDCSRGSGAGSPQQYLNSVDNVAAHHEGLDGWCRGPLGSVANQLLGGVAVLTTERAVFRSSPQQAGLSRSTGESVFVAAQTGGGHITAVVAVDDLMVVMTGGAIVQCRAGDVLLVKCAHPDQVHVYKDTEEGACVDRGARGWTEVSSLLATYRLAS